MKDSSEVASDCPVSTRLTIIGASTRAAADSARRAFFSPYTADLFADLDLTEICTATRVADYPAGFEAILNGPQPGGWLYTGALENYPDLIDRWSKIRPLWGNPGSVLRRVRDPQVLAAEINNAGFPVPAMALSASEVPADGKWLVKPLASAGGQHIVRLTRTTALPTTPHYFQQFIEGDAISAVYLGNGSDAVLLGLTRQLLEVGTFRYQGSLGPIAVPPATLAELERLGQTLVKQFGLIGLFGVDTVTNATGIHTIEVNPRYPAGAEVLERARQFSAIALHVTACQSRKLPEQATHTPTPVSPRPAAGRGAGGEAHFSIEQPPIAKSNREVPLVGKIILYAETNLKITTDLRTRLSNIADIPHPGEQIPQGSPVVTLFRSATSEPELLRALEAAITEARQVIRDPSV